MTYRELFCKAKMLADNSKITLGEYEEMTKPLDREITQEPKTGHWIDIKNKNGTVIAVRCSRCGNSPKYAIKSDFCPNCGADMREVEE